MAITATIENIFDPDIFITSYFIGYKTSNIKSSSDDFRQVIAYGNEAFDRVKLRDWDGFYVATNEFVNRGLLPQYLPSNGVGTAYINSVYIDTNFVTNFDGSGKQVKKVVFSGKALTSASQSAVEQAKLAKAALAQIGINIGDNEPLIQTLGTLGYIYEESYLDNDGNKQLTRIIPLSILSQSSISWFTYQTFTINDFNTTNYTTNFRWQSIGDDFTTDTTVYYLQTSAFKLQIP